MSDRLIRYPEVTTLVGLSRSTIKRLQQKGDFPSPVQISSRAVGFRHSEVLAFIAGRHFVVEGDQ